jgi:hypothetical protein
LKSMCNNCHFFPTVKQNFDDGIFENNYHVGTDVSLQVIVKNSDVQQGK